MLIKANIANLNSYIVNKNIRIILPTFALFATTLNFFRFPNNLFE